MNNINDEKIQEQIERAVKWRDEWLIPAIQKTIDVILPAIQRAIDAITPILEKVIKNMAKLCEAVINSYPNKRVLHLAKYHPKERVRKKNMRRVLKWIERGL